jgi:hypothetical protein
LPTRPPYGFVGQQRAPSAKFDLRFPSSAADNKVRPAAFSGGAAGSFRSWRRSTASQSEAAPAPNHSTMGGDVWSELYDADAFLRAQRLMASAIGSAADYEVLLGQLGEVSDWVFADDADTDQIAERFTRFTAMLVLLGNEGNELFATLVEEALTADEAGADREAIRTTMLHVLDGVAERLLEQIG